ncbi:HEPN domain-containing protein [Mameliella alba]|uniref:HEPN domain-containing protein n=1 Tax=Mameliella alba TaxID=561184 RepID=UPI001431F36D|nr:HEPN domain-containing protein [Mameliella alba]
MIPEVDRLIASHKEIRNGKKGPDPHNAILKSSIIFLCATWELYCESVLIESVKKIVESNTAPDNLPDALKVQLRLAVHDENVFKSTPLKLAGSGWKGVLVDCVKGSCDRFNTPKPKPLDELFKKCIGLKNVSAHWTHGAEEVDKFVRLRGEIAHRGTDSRNVSRATATHYKSVISKAIRDTDDTIYDYLKKPNLLGKAPWQKTKK